jgi:LmbE family N-acetylglucosaminyl deacetylase
MYDFSGTRIPGALEASEAASGADGKPPDRRANVVRCLVAESPPHSGRARVLVLSPHRDDAPLSVGGLLQLIRAHVTVVTVFSRSNWARSRPHEGEEERVSRLRAREDRAALHRLGVTRSRGLGHPDAPLRGYVLEEIFQRRAIRSEPFGRTLERSLVRLVDRVQPDLVLAPLAVGNHVDHRLVRWVAGVSLPKRTRVCLFEDLPYAALATESQIRSLAGTRLAWRVPLTKRQFFDKLTALFEYRSQLSKRDLELVADHAQRRGGCSERLYLALGSVSERLLPGRPG